MRRLLMTCLFVLIATPALAQNRLSFYAVGGATPQSTFDIPSVAVQCNQDHPAAGPNNPLNPRYIIWDDPAVANRACIYDTGTALGVLYSRPVGDHEVSLRFFNAVGVGPESTRAAFRRLDPPTAAPANLRLGGGS